MSRSLVSGRWWAYAGAGLGGALSVAANIAHAKLRPDPETFALVLSASWPVLLYVAIEIIARVAWPRGRTYGVLRWVGLSAVAAVAAIASYRHLSGLLDHYGEDWLTVAIGRLAVDGLMALSTGALIATGRRTRTDTPAAAPVTVEPAGTVEAPDVPADAGSDDTEPADVVAAPSLSVTPARRVRTRPDSAVKVARAAAKLPGGTPAQIAAKAGVSERTARRYLPTPVAASTGTAPAQTPTETPATEDLMEVAA